MSVPESHSAFTVAELTFYLKQKLESDAVLRNVTVRGEISNLTQHGSGHVYFTLKDPHAQISCAMFKGVAMRYLRSMPRHGEQVTLRGELSLYPPRGSYQLIVKDLERTGLGDLHRRFMELRDRLKAEGLFDPVHKQKLPAFPRRIGIATSPTGAVIRDLIDTIRRRYPHVELVLAPTAVQGPQSADSIVRSIRQLNALPDLDLIILARGGGSLEDLWSFNEEVVARAIFASRLPLISGVGHETDVTIADYVADVRAATPTAAGELAVPVAAEVTAWLEDSAQRLQHMLGTFVRLRRERLADLASQLERQLIFQVDFKRQLADDLDRQLDRAMGDRLRELRHRLEKYELELAAMDHRQVLQRGFSVTVRDGKAIRSAAELEPGDEVETHFYEGTARAQITALEINTEDDGQEGQSKQ